MFSKSNFFSSDCFFKLDEVLCVSSNCNVATAMRGNTSFVLPRSVFLNYSNVWTRFPFCVAYFFHFGRSESAGLQRGSIPG